MQVSGKKERILLGWRVGATFALIGLIAFSGSGCADRDKKSQKREAETKEKARKEAEHRRSEERERLRKKHHAERLKLCQERFQATLKKAKAIPDEKIRSSTISVLKKLAEKCPAFSTTSIDCPSFAKVAEDGLFKSMTPAQQKAELKRRWEEKRARWSKLKCSAGTDAPSIARHQLCMSKKHPLVAAASLIGDQRSTYKDALKAMRCLRRTGDFRKCSFTLKRPESYCGA